MLARLGLSWRILGDLGKVFDCPGRSCREGLDQSWKVLGRLGPMGRPPWRALEDLERSREARDAAMAPCPVPARPERIELAAGQEQASILVQFWSRFGQRLGVSLGFCVDSRRLASVARSLRWGKYVLTF